MSTASPRSNTEVLILGGGFTGVMAALEALKHTPAVTLVEKDHCLTDCDETPAFYFHEDWDCTRELKHLGCTFSPVKNAVWKVTDSEGKSVTDIDAFMAEAIRSTTPRFAKDVAVCSLAKEDLQNPQNLKWSGAQAIMFLSSHSKAQDFICTDTKQLKTKLLNALHSAQTREKCEVVKTEGHQAHCHSEKGDEVITCEHIIDTRHTGPKIKLRQDLVEKSPEGTIEYRLNEKERTLTILSPFGKVTYSGEDIARLAAHRSASKETSPHLCEAKKCLHSIEDSLHHAADVVKRDLHL